MTPEGLNFINFLQEIPHKVRTVEYGRFYTNKVFIKRVELIYIRLTDEEYEEAKFHIKNGCHEIVINSKEGDRLPELPPPSGIDFTRIYVDEAGDNEFRDFSPIFSEDVLKNWTVTSRHKELNENSFRGVDGDLRNLSENRLRQKLHEEEAKENYQMCAEILKYAESKGFDLNKN